MRRLIDEMKDEHGRLWTGALDALGLAATLAAFGLFLLYGIPWHLIQAWKGGT